MEQMEDGNDDHFTDELQSHTDSTGQIHRQDQRITWLYHQPNLHIIYQLHYDQNSTEQFPFLSYDTLKWQNISEELCGVSPIDTNASQNYYF